MAENLPFDAALKRRCLAFLQTFKPIACSISALMAAFLCALMLVVWWLPEESLERVLQFDHAKINNGEWWRIFTGNYVHFTLYHVLMNVGGLLAIGVFFWPPKHWLFFSVCVVGISLGIGLGLFFITPDLDLYRGFSGALYGLLAVALLLNLKNDPLWFGLVLACLAGKIIYEQLPVFDPNYMQAQIGVPVASEAHLYGVLIGVVFFTLHFLNYRFLARAKCV